MKVLANPQSGSYQGLTASRNRFGQYIRTRAMPVQPRTPAQQTIRGILAGLSATWRTLTSTVRANFNALGLSMTRTDSLGQTYTLSGQEAYVGLNTRLLAAGQTALTDAPAISTPDAVDIGAITANSGTLSIAFSPTPVGAAEFVNVYASPQRSPGRTFEGDFRLIQSSTLAQTSPLSVLTNYEARFGTLVSGNKIFFRLERCNTDGFASTATGGSAIVA